MASKPSFAGQALGLFTDILVGIRAALKTIGGTDEHLEKLREPHFFEIAAAYAMGSVITISAAAQTAVQSAVATVLQFVDRTITITMDLTKSLDQLIADGKYNWVNSDIAKLFTVAPEAGTQTRQIELLWYQQDMTNEAVLVNMERQGLRPATLLELLWIGIQHPLLQLNFPIVALGSVMDFRGNRCVVFLGRDDRGRGLRLNGFNNGWSVRCRFAAVRLPALRAQARQAGK